MTIIPKLQTRFGENIGVELFITHPDLYDNNQTFVNTDSAISDTSLTVDNGLKFSVSQYVVIGNIGAERTEIGQIHAATTPTSTTLTLQTTNSFAHPRGSSVTFIPFNQVFIERSTDGGATYSTLATVDIRPDSRETYYQHASGAATDYYRVSFKNEDTSDFSEVSDGMIATGQVAGTAGHVIREALMQLGEYIDGKVITKEFLYSALNHGRDEIDRDVNVDRWSFRTSFDYNAGQVTPGNYQLTLPADMRDSATSKNLLSVRVGRDKYHLRDVDKRSINLHYRGIAHTTLNGAVAAVDTTITLTESGDFDESGSVDIAAPTVNGTIDAVAYTGNNELTNVISGVTGIATGGHATLIDVWQGASFRAPSSYNVDNSVITFDSPFPNDLAGEVIWLDYYKEITEVNSDADALDEPFYRIYIPYLKWRIKQRKNPQIEIGSDPDFVEWSSRKNDQINKEFTGQDIRFIPRVPGL